MIEIARNRRPQNPKTRRPITELTTAIPYATTTCARCHRTELGTFDILKGGFVKPLNLQNHLALQIQGDRDSATLGFERSDLQNSQIAKLTATEGGSQ